MVSKRIFSTTILGVALLASMLMGINISNPKVNSAIKEGAVDLFNLENGVRLQQDISEGEVSYSKTFVQYGTNELEQYCIRFATAVKGDFTTLSYTRKGIDGVNNGADVVQNVQTLYYSIQSDGDRLYYTGDTSVNDGLSTEVVYREDYYWACYTITFTDYTLYLDYEIEVNLTIDNSIVCESRKTTLNELLSAQKDITKIEAEKFLGSSKYPAIVAEDMNYVVPNTKYGFKASEESKYIVSKASEPASGDAYVGEFNAVGKGLTLHYNAKTSRKANLYIAASSGVIAAGSGWTPTSMKDIQINQMLSVSVNNNPVTIADDVILPGGTIEDVGEGNNGLLWVNWKVVNLGEFEFVAGDNSIYIEIIKVEKHASNTGSGAINLDYFSCEKTEDIDDPSQEGPSYVEAVGTVRIEAEKLLASSKYPTLSYEDPYYIEANAKMGFDPSNESKYIISKAGEPASGDAYLGEMSGVGKGFTLHVYSSKARKASFTLCASSGVISAGSGWTPTSMKDIQLNQMVKIDVNGTNAPIADDVILPGGTIEDVGEGNNGLLWVNWKTVQFNDIDLVAGDNLIYFEIIAVQKHASTNASGSLNIDYFDVTLQ